MKKFIYLLVSALVCFLGLGVTACSDASFEGEEYGVTSLAFSARNSPNYQMGVRTAASHLQCDRTSTGQVCSVPKAKNIQVAMDASASIYGADISDALILIDGMLGQSWTLSMCDIDSCPTLQPTQVRMLTATGAIAGALSSNVDRYSSITLGSPQNLTEGVAPGANTPVGSYQRHGHCVATIDVDSLHARGEAGGVEGRNRRHAFAHAVLTCMGLGSRTDSGANGVFSRRTLAGGVALGGMTGGEACRANSLNVTDNGDFSLTTDFVCGED